VSLRGHFCDKHSKDKLVYTVHSFSNFQVHCPDQMVQNLSYAYAPGGLIFKFSMYEARVHCSLLFFFGQQTAVSLY